MSLYRVALTEGGEGADPHVVVCWRKDWTGTVREVRVMMDDDELTPEPARPGRPATVFRTPDGRIVGVYVVAFPWLGLRPIVWFDGQYAAGTLATWANSRIGTAMVLAAAVAVICLAVVVGLRLEHPTPLQAAWSAALCGASLVAATLGVRALLRPHGTTPWTAPAAVILAGAGAIVTLPVGSILLILIAAVPALLMTASQIRLTRVLGAPRTHAEPPPPAGG